MTAIRPRSLSLLAAGVALGIGATTMFVNAWSVDAAAGDDDTTFVPIAPCRLVDTRPGADRVGPIDTFGSGVTQTVPARGPVGNCVIPTDAVGLSLNVTAIGASSGTFVTIWPDGDRPLVSSLNPAPGQPPTPNAVVTPLSATGSFQAFNVAGSVDLIIDVNGYYTASSLQEISARLSALETAGGATGAAGGDLTGSYPSPQIAANALGSAEVADNSLTGADVNESGLAIAGDVTGTLGASQLAGNSVGSAEVAANALVLSDLAFGVGEEQTIDHSGVLAAGACALAVDDEIDVGVAPVGSRTFVVAVGRADGGLNDGWTVDGETTLNAGFARVKVCNNTGSAQDPPNLIFGYITIAP